MIDLQHQLKSMPLSPPTPLQQLDQQLDQRRRWHVVTTGHCKLLFLCCCMTFFLSCCHVTLAQDPLYQPQRRRQQQRQPSGRSIFNIFPASQRQRLPVQQRYNTYKPDFSARILSEEQWKADKRARVYETKPRRRRNDGGAGMSSWTNRLVLVNVLAHVAQMLFPPLTSWGIKLSDKILRGQQLYRLATPMFLHGGIAHLFTNMYSLLNIGPDLERLIGSDRLVYTYLLSGVAGNLVSAWASPNPSLGASGAVFGLVSAYYVFFLRNEWMLGQWGLQMQQAITQTIALNLLLGALNPMVDQWGHVGGAIGGATVAYFMGPRLFLSTRNHINQVIIDRPYVRIPNWIETMPQRILIQPWTRLTQQLQQQLPFLSSPTSSSTTTAEAAAEAPWRQDQGPPQRQQQQRRNTPNRSIKPRW